MLKVGIFFLFVFPPPRPRGTEVGAWGEGRHEHGLVAVTRDDFQKCVVVIQVGVDICYAFNFWRTTVMLDVVSVTIVPSLCPRAKCFASVIIQ